MLGSKTNLAKLELVHVKNVDNVAEILGIGVADKCQNIHILALNLHLLIS